MVDQQPETTDNIEQTKENIEIRREVSENDRFKYGEVILIYENKETIKCLTLEKGKVFQNKFGAFKHDDIVGKPFGSKIVSEKTKGFITALRFIPYLWERSISRLTQILFNPDISIILTLLNVSKNSIIYESGKYLVTKVPEVDVYL
jgi:tRNA (adenine57-N1/adenine58-N1)-methyltransferase